MKRLISRLILWLMRWKVNKDNIPKEAYGKCVMIAAPHTSNWDFPLAMSTMSVLNIDIRYTIKKEWMGFPLGWLFRWLGGIGIDRSKKKEGETKGQSVEHIAKLFNEHENLCIIVQPEGTRALRKQWKTGFYYIALAASVPIVLGYLDYSKKEAGISSKVIYPSGDIQKDMVEIMEFYKDKTPAYPELFSLDERFLSLDQAPPPPDSNAPQTDKENNSDTTNPS